MSQASDLGIEKVLFSVNRALYAKYIALREKLFNEAYPFWQVQFQFGNDHGEGHILRVLENLDRLLGPDPIGAGKVGAYELFLSMLSVLYHDIGMLVGRENHPEIGGARLVESIKGVFREDPNNYIFHPHDRSVIKAAVVSHGSNKSIEEECRGLPRDLYISGHKVRPHVVAALVRLADELDEDFRRAPIGTMSDVAVPEGSRFYWEFCQRISGVQPDPHARQIIVYMSFQKDDVGRTVKVGNSQRLFIAAVAEKLAKMGEERRKTAAFLPEALRYERLVISVNPLPDHPTWTAPREFSFSDHTPASAFISTFPELLLGEANLDLMGTYLLVSARRYDDARVELIHLREKHKKKPLAPYVRDFVVYNLACVESTVAQGLGAKAGKASLDQALEYLRDWIKGRDWTTSDSYGRKPEELVHRMATDDDLAYLLCNYEDRIRLCLPENLRPYFQVPKLRAEKIERSSGGCLTPGTLISTPDGLIPVECIREKDEVHSLDLDGNGSTLTTNVTRIAKKKTPSCLRINGNLLASPSQPVRERGHGWIKTEVIEPGMSLLGGNGGWIQVNHLETISGPLDVFIFTTDHPSHNFIANGFVCHNEKP